MGKPFDIDKRIAELRREYNPPTTTPVIAYTPPPVIKTYDECEFVRPRKVISNQCPCCGQPWKFPVNARMCPACGDVKYLHEFTTKTGMCKECRHTRMVAFRERQRAYQRDYYHKKLKDKRKAKRESAKQRERQQVVESFKQLVNE